MSLSISQTNTMVSLFRQELELCKVRPGETVAVLSEAEQAVEYASAFMIAARELGVDVFNVNLPARGADGAQNVAGDVGQNALAGNGPAIEALKSADLVVDLIFLLFSKEQLEIQAADTRILLVVEPFEVLSRLFPTQGLRERVEAAEARLAKAQNLRFTNPAGTDVQYELGQFPILTEYGFTDTPGRWDHWPGGFLATQGSETGVNGTVVMDRGDMNLTFKRYIESPVTLRIQDDYVVDVEGVGTDAALFRSYTDAWGDREAYATSHVGWGMNPGARWDTLSMYDRSQTNGTEQRAFAGNFLYSTGANEHAGRHTLGHFDLPMRNHSVSLDGEAVVIEGALQGDLA